MLDIPPIELLPPLVALLETESVTLAAARMHVGQPAMSRTLEKLRLALGDVLLVRSGRGLVRTQRGEALLPEARALLEQAQSLLTPSAGFDAATATGQVTLALGDDMQSMMVGNLLARLRNDAPCLDVRVRSLGLESVAQMLRGHIDLMVAPDLRSEYPQLMSDEFVLTSCYERRFVAVTRARHKLSLAAFLAAEHVLVAPTGDDTGYVDAALRAQGRSRRLAVTVPTFQAALTLVQQSNLVATLPDDLTRRLAPALYTQKCPVATPKLNMCVLWAQRFKQNPRHTWLRNVVAEIVSCLGSSP